MTTIRLRIIGDLGEQYDVTLDDWERLVANLQRQGKSLHVTLQEARLNLDTLDQSPWETVAIYCGEAENGYYCPEHHVGLQHPG